MPTGNEMKVLFSHTLLWGRACPGFVAYCLAMFLLNVQHSLSQRGCQHGSEEKLGLDVSMGRPRREGQEAPEPPFQMHSWWLSGMPGLAWGGL